jgi:hypothetical protein
MTTNGYQQRKGVRTTTDGRAMFGGMSSVPTGGMGLADRAH